MRLGDEDAAGFEVRVAGEAVGSASQDLEQVVGAFDASVAGPSRLVPVEDLLVPREERVDGAAGLGYLPAAVDVGEPVERFEGAFAVLREIEAVQLAERVPCRFEPRVGLEQGVEPLALGVVERVGPFGEHESGPEHCGPSRKRGMTVG